MPQVPSVILLWNNTAASQSVLNTLVPCGKRGHADKFVSGSTGVQVATSTPVNQEDYTLSYVYKLVFIAPSVLFSNN
jgi:hypothetical protein